MKLAPCCCKSLKHGESVCVVCGQVLIPVGIPQQLAIKFKENQK